MNSITRLKNNKFIRIISLITVTAGAFIVIVFFISNKVFPDYTLFDLLFIPMELRTTIEHQKALGIKPAKISGAEEKQLKSMIDESIKAQLEYYSTKKDENLDRVKNLYLPSGFEQYKESVKRVTIVTEETQKYYEDEKLKFDIQSIQSYNKIKLMKFSRPVIYKDLPDRIGIINHIEFNSNTNNLTQIFIFKDINGEWKIEKQREIVVRPEITEELIIKEIKKEK